MRRTLLAALALVVVVLAALLLGFGGTSDPHGGGSHVDPLTAFGSGSPITARFADNFAQEEYLGFKTRGTGPITVDAARFVLHGRLKVVVGFVAPSKSNGWSGYSCCGAPPGTPGWGPMIPVPGAVLRPHSSYGFLIRLWLPITAGSAVKAFLASVTITFQQGGSVFEFTEQTPTEMCSYTTLAQCQYGQLLN